MRAHWFRASSSVVALLLGVATAQAQDATGTTTTTVTRNSASGEIGVEAKPSLTSQDMIAQADAIQRRASQVAERISKMLEEARAEKDIIRANFLNRKLTVANATARNIEDRVRSLKAAVAAGDTDRARHEFAVLTVLSEKLSQLDEEATQALGQGIYEPGASQVTATIAAGTATASNPASTASPPAAPPAFTVPGVLSPR